jgi:hypothetical protein
MDVASGRATAQISSDYRFTVRARGRSIFSGNAVAKVSQDGSSKVVAALSVEAVQALREGSTVDVTGQGIGTQQFSLAGSKAAINSSSCGV